MTTWAITFALAVLCAATATAPAQTFQTLVSFNGKNGGGTTAALVQGLNGAFYGTTSGGGAYGQGTVFTISPQGAIRKLYDFCGQTDCADGSDPTASLTLAFDGRFYGTTAHGGTNCVGSGCGTVFRISASGTLSTIYSFCARPNCTDGVLPFGGLIQASDFNLYGMTNGGGGHGYGTVFRLTRTGVLNILHYFCTARNCLDGSDPRGSLTLGSDGNLYGTTSTGGATGMGEVFKITQTGEFFVLHSFCTNDNCSDGANPLAGMIQGNDGNLYGTTSGPATVFKITPQGELTTLYLFCTQTNCPDGDFPVAPLVQATDGKFYGTTSYGANPACQFGCGTIFSITPQGSLTTLHTFCSHANCADGGVSEAGLLQATNGILYGTTSQGGGRLCNCGIVFSLSMGLGPFVAFVNDAGQVGQQIGILGQGLTGTTGVSLNGTVSSFTVKSDTLVVAIVPAGATSGLVTVATPNGTLTSNLPFQVIP